jgi:lipopolysaccharide transport system permease protein
MNETASSLDGLAVTTYDASGRDRIALSAWRVMFRELHEFRELVYRLVLRNFTSQFRQSFLGCLWIAFPPLATTLIFALLRQAAIVDIPMEGIAMPYALYALVGVTIWGTFTQVVLAVTGSISGGGALVSKVYFPREVLVMSAVGGALIGALIRAVVVLLSFALFLYVPHWQIVWVPLALLPMVFLAVGLGMFFAPVNTMMHDMGRMLEFLFQFGMFLVPSIYPTPDLAKAESAWQAALFWMHRLNPVSYSIDAARALISEGSYAFGPGFLAASVLGLLVFAMGWRFFHVCEPLLAERL